MAVIPVHRFPPVYGPMPRLLEVVPEEVVLDGQRLSSIRVPGSKREPLVLSPEALAIARFLDGTRDLRGVQTVIYQQYGQLLYVERIHELAMALHRAGLLAPRTDRPTADALLAALPPAAPAASFAGSLRPAMHAGTAYEADPHRLRQTLDALFSHPDGPGVEATPGPTPVTGLVAPHIDLFRGGPVYAHAYKALAEGADADLFVVLGTAHQSPQNLFTATRASYDTPFGPVPTDAVALGILARELGAPLFADEAAHAEEHSIEFQALYLRYLYGDRPITMLPILCSSLYACAARGGRPGDEPELERFLAALAKATAGRRVCIIASADLSHVGTLFGDARGPTSEELALLGERDVESLSHLVRLDPEAFFDHVGPDGDSRRICGLTPIYTMLRACGGARARILKYAQWHGADEASAVTYAAAVVEQA